MNSNHLIKFKGQLWQTCVDNNVFNDIPESNLDNCKKSFENIVSNYTSQIMQSDDTVMLQNIIMNEIKKDVAKLKVMIRDDIKSRNQEQFDMRFKKMQDDYNNQHKKNIPNPPPEFNQNVSDEPLDNTSLENLINEQMNQRKNLFNNSLPTIDEKNEVIETIQQPLNVNEPAFQHTQDTSIGTSVQHITTQSNPNSNSDSIIELKDKIEQLDKKVDIVLSIMTKLINSHIALLKKIK
jgi:hypothetical protein